MSKAALSDFLVKQAFLGATAEYMGLSGVYHGDTSDYPYVSGTLTNEQIIIRADKAPVEVKPAPAEPIKITNSPVMPSLGFGARLEIWRAERARLYPKP